MKSFEYTIKDELGIHARPAGMLVKEAKNFASECTITKDGKTKKLTQLMMLMSLGVKQGDTVKQGDLLVKVDVEYLKAQGKSVVSPVIFTSGEKIELQKTGAVQNGENDIVKIR